MSDDLTRSGVHYDSSRHPRLVFAPHARLEVAASLSTDWKLPPSGGKERLAYIFELLIVTQESLARGAHGGVAQPTHIIRTSLLYALCGVDPSLQLMHVSKQDVMTLAPKICESLDPHRQVSCNCC